MSLRKAFFIFILFFTLIRSTLVFAEEVTIAVASNFMRPFMEIRDLYTKKTSRQILVSYGSTGKLSTQIARGAPFDIFLAADKNKPLLLEEEGFAQKNSRFTYAVGYLVLAVPEKIEGDCHDRLFSLLKSSYYFGIADPMLAPYGQAAKEVLSSFKKWPLEKKLVMGKNVSQTYQWLITKNIGGAFLPKSFFQKREKKDALFICEIDHSRYSPIEQQAVLLKRAEQNKLAQDFYSFLRSDRDVAKIINSYGYEANKVLSHVAD